MSTALSKEHGTFDRLGQQCTDRCFEGGYLFWKRFDVFNKGVRVLHQSTEVVESCIPVYLSFNNLSGRSESIKDDGSHG